MKYNVVIIDGHLEPDHLLIGTVFHKVVLSKVVRVVLYKSQLGIIETRGNMKLCERSSDQVRGSGGGITGPMALKL